MVYMLERCIWILQKRLTVLIMRSCFRSSDIMALLVHLCWFASYLFGRSQWVCYTILNYLVQEMLQLVYLMQDSILGPLLLSLYVNDLPHAVVSSDVYQYADDT